jgi:hypothetical protein
MANHSDGMQSHEHKGPRCKTSDAGAICHEEACQHDHHISRHAEVSCTPVKGQHELFNCVHSAITET